MIDKALIKYFGTGWDYIQASSSIENNLNSVSKHYALEVKFLKTDIHIVMASSTHTFVDGPEGITTKELYKMLLGTSRSASVSDLATRSLSRALRASCRHQMAGDYKELIPPRRR